jgi:hypothetical protein
MPLIWDSKIDDANVQVRLKRLGLPNAAIYDSLRDTIGALVTLAQNAIRDQEMLYWVVPGC